MNNLQTSSQTLPAQSAGHSPAIRELSTEQRKDWIERIFTRLSGIYGSEFTYKWADVDNNELKREWADTLGGFHAEDIAAALHACRSQPKAPNLPEFSALCRQSMNVRSKPVEAPLTAEERAAARKVADTVSRSMSEKDEKKGYYVNGVLVTGFKQWAVDLMKREAAGEASQNVSAEAWRKVLGYAQNTTAKEALKAAEKVAA